MKILLANFSKMVNASGGLAKVTCAFANEMIRRNHSVALSFIDEHDGIFFYPIDSKTRLYNLCKMSGQNIRMPLRYRIEREVLRPIDIRRAREVNDLFVENYLLENVKTVLEIENPDVIISSQLLASRILLCTLDTKIPVITMSHGDPEDYFHTYPVKEIPAIEKSAACQVLMPSFVEHLKSRFPNLHVETIGNVVPQFEKTDLSRRKDIYRIIFVGRLVRNHKRPHLLIEAFAKIASEIKENWIVELWGENDSPRYTKRLQSMIKKFGLEDKVFLRGTTRNIERMLKSADIFATTSAYEGFSLALGESMSAGLPSVGYKNCVAVNELIVDGKNGFLCEDGTDDFADKLLKLIQNRELRIKFGQSAHDEMRKYKASIIWNQWEDLIERVAKK